jgi:hypothetical protein
MHMYEIQIQKTQISVKKDATATPRPTIRKASHPLNNPGAHTQVDAWMDWPQQNMDELIDLLQTKGPWSVLFVFSISISIETRTVFLPPGV